MADKTPEQEPSIEEILASIRQIISDDEEKESDDEQAEQPVAENAAPAAPAPALEPEEEDEPEEIEPEEEDEDVLELTNPLPADPAPKQQPKPEAPFQPAPAPRVSAADREEPTMPHTHSRADDGDDILTGAAKQAALASLSKLTGSAVPINRARDYDGVTLEDIVRDLLQPILRDWMSENLPPMVERIVQKELEKLARMALDD